MTIKLKREGQALVAWQLQWKNFFCGFPQVLTPISLIIVTCGCPCGCTPQNWESRCRRSVRLSSFSIVFLLSEILLKIGISGLIKVMRNLNFELGLLCDFYIISRTREIFFIQCMILKFINIAQSLKEQLIKDSFTLMSNVLLFFAFEEKLYFVGIDCEKICIWRKSYVKQVLLPK